MKAAHDCSRSAVHRSFNHVYSAIGMTDVSAGHAEIQGAGCTMCTHGNSIYVFGGMSEDRTEHHRLWRWDLSTEDGFVAVKYRYLPIRKLAVTYDVAVLRSTWKFHWKPTFSPNACSVDSFASVREYGGSAATAAARVKCWARRNDQDNCQGDLV